MSSSSSSSSTIEEQSEDIDEPMTAAHHLLHMLGPAYARKRQFWVAIGYSVIPQGLFMALVALGFFNFYLILAQKTWLQGDYHHAVEHVPIKNFFSDLINDKKEEEEHEDDAHVLDPLRLSQGEWWYVGLLAGAGFGVGLVKVLWNLFFKNHKVPIKFPGFVEDLRELKAHDVWMPLPMLICSALSIGFGASVGPEAALGATGTALGSLVIARRWKVGSHIARKYVDPDNNKDNNNDEQDNDDEDYLNLVVTDWLPDLSNESALCALDGISAAFGGLLPSQYLSPLLVHEMGGHWGASGTKFNFAFMETVTRTGLSATIAYTLFTGLQKLTLLSELPLPFAAYDLFPEITPIHMLMALVLGILCGGIGLLGFVTLGFGGALGTVAFKAIDGIGKCIGLSENTMGMLLTPAVGGALVGLLCVLCPLALGDGADQIGTLIYSAYGLGTINIVVTGLVKLLTVSLSLGFGFVGGQIFPLVFTGTCTGVAVHLIWDAVPILVSLPCCMVAVPCAFMPAMFTFTTLASMVIALGGAATSPVFLACTMSYTTVAGFGTVQGLIQSSLNKKKQDNANDKASSLQQADDEVDHEANNGNEQSSTPLKEQQGAQEASIEVAPRAGEKSIAA